MIGNRSVLGVIPARGGSKRVPRKNLRQVGGRPLIAWTIEEARKSRYLDRLILSSEDPEIIRVAQSLHCEAPFVRPAALAEDETPGIAPVLHALSEVPGYDIVVLLQPTSPLRAAEDIDRCLEHFIASRADVCVSITPVQQSLEWMYGLNSRGALTPIALSVQPDCQHQEQSPVYVLNGAVYVADCSFLRASKNFVGPTTQGFVMPRERSIDIDTELDLKMAGMILEQQS
jgi:CMP-N,N'-diacetyllegionaminic acid synthase